MNIALDFDDTYTRDPKFWDEFILIAKERGHDVRIVTFRMRRMTDPALDYLATIIPVIFTEYTKKRKFTNSIGWMVDIWIDDSPEFIVGDLE
jgi:hydroxymethylpyrimidine pyrophosphatase-like HAD family hydrolase